MVGFCKKKGSVSMRYLPRIMLSIIISIMVQWFIFKVSPPDMAEKLAEAMGITSEQLMQVAGVLVFIAVVIGLVTWMLSQTIVSVIGIIAMLALLIIFAAAFAPPGFETRKLDVPDGDPTTIVNPTPVETANAQ